MEKVSSYIKNKKYILHYQKTNKNYRKYKRKYEREYSEKNRIMWNFKSWKSVQRKAGKRITIKKEFIYIVNRVLQKELNV